MPDPRVAATFKHVHEAHNIGINVGRRVLDRVAHTGLGRQMYDSFELAGDEELAHRLAVDDIEFLELESRPGAQPFEPRLLEPDVVIVVQIVDADDLVTAVEQGVR